RNSRACSISPTACSARAARCSSPSPPTRTCPGCTPPSSGRAAVWPSSRSAGSPPPKPVPGSPARTTTATGLSPTAPPSPNSSPTATARATSAPPPTAPPRSGCTCELDLARLDGVPGLHQRGVRSQGPVGPDGLDLLAAPQQFVDLAEI